MTTNALDWVGRHSDAFHPGTRDECDHCQAMIAAFGPMPAAAEIELASQRSRHSPSAKVPIPDRVRWEVWERDNFTCRGCGGRRDLTVDHIVPESRGGTLALENLQTLCRSCNSRKGTRGPA